MPRAETIASEQRERARRAAVASERAGAGLPTHRIAAPTDRPDRWITRCRRTVSDAAATSDPERVSCAACAVAPAPPSIAARPVASIERG